MKIRGSRRVLLGGALLAAGLFAAPHATYAHISICRSDPIIWLSNGAKVQMNATINTDQNDVKQVHYDVHLPSGVQILRVVYTQGKMRHLESFDSSFDSAANAYTVNTLVSTTNSVPVTATEQVVDPTSSQKEGTQGTSNQVLSTTVKG